MTYSINNLCNYRQETNHYKLKVLQQPIKARLCSFKEKVDRRPIDPPPIVQLCCTCQHQQCNYNILHSPYFFLYATLTGINDDTDLYLHHGHRTTAGSVVQSLHRLKYNDNKDGGFFVFADISVRLEGRYRLKFTLFEIVGETVQRLVSVISDPFTVYSPKYFPGMSESTSLTKSFSDQGVRIRIRKDTRHATKRQRTNKMEDEEDDEMNYSINHPHSHYQQHHHPNDNNMINNNNNNNINHHHHLNDNINIDNNNNNNNNNSNNNNNNNNNNNMSHHHHSSMNHHLPMNDHHQYHHPLHKTPSPTILPPLPPLISTTSTPTSSTSASSLSSSSSTTISLSKSAMSMQNLLSPPLEKPTFYSDRTLPPPTRLLSHPFPSILPPQFPDT
ncbi:unnamed protein product [Cunninghamella blakesleeana]